MTRIISSLRTFVLLPACLAFAACGSSSSTPATTPAAPQAAAPMADDKGMANDGAMADKGMANDKGMTNDNAMADKGMADKGMADKGMADKGMADKTPPAEPQYSLSEPTADKLGARPAGLGLDVGTKAPDATLVDVNGKQQKLASLYAQGPTFVVFYRGGWCPFCNVQLHQLTTAKADFDRKGIRLVAISVDQPSEESKTQAKQGVPFPMLSDSTLVAHKAFNVVHVANDNESQMMAKYGVNLEAYSGQTHHSYAVASLFLVDKAGKIRWEHIDNDYKTRPSPAQMLEVADRVLKKK